MSTESIITPEVLETKLRAEIPDVVFVKATDLSEGTCGSKFEIEIVSAFFTGKPLLVQHRAIHKAIEEERKHIHALTIKSRATI